MGEVRLIDADTLHYAFDDEGADLCLSINMGNMWGFSYDSVHTLINKAPTVDAVPVVHGHWIKKDDRTICSNCRTDIPTWDGSMDIFQKDNLYCYNCGAKMRD